MKHFNIVLTLLLVVGLVASGVFAGVPQKTAGRLPIPMKESETPLKAQGKQLSAMQQLKRIDRSEVYPSDPATQNVSEPVFTKREITPDVRAIMSGLSGTIHVGAANQFKTIGDIAFLLNIANISGPVTFLLDDPAYAEAAGVLIGASPGVSAVNTITIQPNAGNTACVISIPDNTGNLGGLAFNGAQYITIEGTAVGDVAGNRDLTIHLTSAPSAANGGDAPVRLTNCSNMTVTDCIITGNSPSAAWSLRGATNGNASVSMNSTTGFVTSHITVNNCDLSGGHFGVLSRGNFPVVYPGDYGKQDDHITVSNSYIHDVTERGISLEQVSYAAILSNLVKRVVLGSGAGGSPNLLSNGPSTVPDEAGVTGSLANYPLKYRVAGIQVWGDNAQITKNRVDSVWNNRTSSGTFSASAYGIRVFSFDNNDNALSWGGVLTHNVLVNNIVTRVYSKATQTNQPGHAIGIEIASGRSDTLYHNTIYFSGSEAAVNHPGGDIAVFTSGAYVSAAGFPAWVDPATTAYFARTFSKNNILAINRAGTTSANALVAMTTVSTPSLDWRTGSNNDVMYLGAAGNIGIGAAGATMASLYAFNQAGGGTVEANGQADDPTLNSESDVTINPAGKSTADGTGANLGGRVPTDFAGTVRGTPPNIGAYEGHGAGLPHDVKPVALVSPGPAGAPAGLPFSPVQITLINLGGFTETNFNYNVHIVNPDASTQDLPGTATLSAGGAATVTVPGSWNPGSTGGSATFTLTTSLVGDDYPGNDNVGPLSVAVAAQATAPYSSGFETAGDIAGWFVDGDFALGSNTGGNTKLGGAHGGDKCYVTKPGAPGTGYTAATVSHVYTPFFDLSSAPAHTSISFFHSLRTEPKWDRSFMEYSLDTGKTWQPMGQLNDPAGVNWYSTAVYANAQSDVSSSACMDLVTWNSLVGLPVPQPGWSSNGACAGADVTTGPFGYIFVQLDLSGVSPTPIGHSYVRFRYLTWSDAGGVDDGWALDDFSVGPAAVFPGDPVSGKVFNDVNGNGVNDAEPNVAGAQVDVQYFGTHLRYATTDINGNYVDTLKLPGTYNLVLVTNSSTAVTLAPAPISSQANGTSHTGQDFGEYLGSVSGFKIEDINNNGLVDGGEPGLPGFTIEMHRDSLNGALVGSAVSAVGGAYQIPAVPGTYYLKETAAAGFRQTGATSHTVSVTGSSGSPTANPTGVDFTNFALGSIRVALETDANGNGVRDGGDLIAMPAPFSEAFTFQKTSSGGPVVNDTVGFGNSFIHHTLLDTGSYTITRVSVVPAGWRNTKDQTYHITITHSSENDTASYLAFKDVLVSGTVFEDHNGNGAADVGDQGISGDTVVITGSPNTNAVTDGSGNYGVTVGPGHHVITLPLTGWTQTAGGGPTYTFDAVSANLGGNKTGKNFGEFKNVCISGTKYRDRNNNGTRDPGEEGLSGWTINVGAHSTVTDGSGNWSICNIGPEVDTVREVAQLNWTETQPVAGYYVVTTSSGTNVGSLAFGNTSTSDNAKYRTFTAADFGGSDGKPAKAWKTKAHTTPNFYNEADIYFKGGGAGVSAGAPGILGFGGKELCSVGPSKEGDFYKTFNSHGLQHSGAPDGLSFTDAGKQMFKHLKSLPASTKNDVLVADLLALSFNVQVSGAVQAGFGPTPIAPAGLGNLIYVDANSNLSGLTIAQIVAQADTFITIWPRNPLHAPIYTGLDTVIAKINAAFRTPIAVANYDTQAWKTGGLHLNGVVSLASVPFLKANPGAKPIITPLAKYTAPVAYALRQNYPNPFNPTTYIDFDIPATSVVTLKVYNILGQEVATLADHQSFEAGPQEVQFDATNYASGIYLYRLVAEKADANGNATSQTYIKTMKMVLLK